MAKNRKVFKRFFSALSAMGDKTLNVRTKPVLSGFDVIYQRSWQTWYLSWWRVNVKEILYNT